MNSTPPSARLTTSLVLGAVCPTYWPTRSSRVTETRWPFSMYPRRCRMLAIRRATVVFPVPGLPVRLMCSVGCSEPRSICSRSRSITSSAAISRIRRLTGAIPIRSRSSSASTSRTPESRTTDCTSACPSATASEKSTAATAEPVCAPWAGLTPRPVNSSANDGDPWSPGCVPRERPAGPAAGLRSSGRPVVSSPRGVTVQPSVQTPLAHEGIVENDALGLPDPVVGRDRDPVARRRARGTRTRRVPARGGVLNGRGVARAREVPPVAVAAPDRVLDGIRVDCVADLAVGLVLALEAKPRLLGGAVDDEAEHRGLAPQRAVITDQFHVVVRVGLSTRLDIAHRHVGLLGGQVELGLLPDVPEAVARVRVVGVLDHDRPPVAQPVADLSLDLLVGQVVQERERSLCDPHRRSLRGLATDRGGRHGVGGVGRLEVERDVLPDLERGVELGTAPGSVAQDVGAL